MSNQQNPFPGGSPTGQQGPKKGPRFNLSWVYGIIAVALVFLYIQGSEAKEGITRNISYSEFKDYVGKGYAEKVVAYDDNKVELTIITDSAIRIFGQSAVQVGQPVVLNLEVGSIEALDRFLDEQKKEGSFNGKLDYKKKNNTLSNLFWNIFPFIALIAIWMFIMRRMGGGGAGGPGGVFNVGKSKAQLFEKGDNNRVTFKDVAGQAEAKQEVQEIVEFLKKPEKFTELGGKIPKGALLVGPPGTGKTLLAKAVAGEADVPFFSLSGSDFVEMFVGVGASRVRDLFRQAKEKAPCIIFIDEIDAVGRARGKNPAMGGNDERENTLNQLLTEMDGFGTNSGIIILAATNRVDILDKALLRAGRFDRQIHVDLPDLNERKEVFGVHLRPLKLDKSLDIDLLARQTPGFSGADIANVCNEAALIAARHGKNTVDKDDFLAAVDRIIGGLEKKTKVLTMEEKRTIALHEAGHATLSWHLQYADPLVKVTIVPRGRALGAAWYLPEERQITTKEQMLDEMCAILGGRAAEELFVGRISTGAMNDLERVTKQAYGMIAYAGMGDRLPNLCYYNTQEQFHKPYSEKTAELIDNEVKALIAEQYERAKRMLLQYSEGHRELAELLMEREVIFAEDAERIFGKRQWASRSEEILEPAVENTEKSEKASKRASKKAKSADSVAVGQTEDEEEKIASEVAAEPVADSVKTAEVESPNVSEPQTASEPSAAPVLTESPDYSKTAKPKSERTRKPKDENLFDGFDFDQEKTE